MHKQTFNEVSHSLAIGIIKLLRQFPTHILGSDISVEDKLLFREKSQQLRLNAVLKMGHWDVFLLLVQILVLTRSCAVTMMVCTIVHPTKVQTRKVLGLQSKGASRILHLKGDQAFEHIDREK